MMKITVEGQEVRCIVTSPEVPQPVELIEQSNGQCVSIETCSALAREAVDPAGDGEAAELARWLWGQGGNPDAISPQWNGWQAAAWIATNDLAVVARLASPIEFRGKAGSWAGERPTLHVRTVEACLRWEIATRYCQCGADRDGGSCLCLDGAFGKLNAALREGAVIELGQQSMGPVNRENARGMLFASRAVRDRSEFVIVEKTTQRLRDGSQLIDEGTMLELVKTLEITSARRLNSEQRKRWPEQAWSRDAIDVWYREKFNPTSRTGPKKKAIRSGNK